MALLGAQAWKEGPGEGHGPESISTSHPTELISGSIKKKVCGPVGLGNITCSFPPFECS